MKLSTELLWSAAVAALGGFLFGFDTAVISGATDALRLQFALDSGQLGFTVASALLGTIVGSVAAGAPAERYGRRPVLRALAVLYFLSAVGCGLAPTWVSLLIFRFIGGLAIGASWLPAARYPADVAFFRIGIALTVLPLGFLAARVGPRALEPAPVPFPLHIQALIGTAPVLWLFRIVGIVWLGLGAWFVAGRWGGALL